MAKTHEFFKDALEGRATPGDPEGPADVDLHNAGFAQGTSLTSWSTDQSVAESFAGKGGVVLQTTMEQLAAKGVYRFSNLQTPSMSPKFLSRELSTDSM